MRGLIEMAIEREAERLDEILEPGNTSDIPFFTPRHFRSRIRTSTNKFASRGARRRYSANAAASHYSN